MSNARGPIDVWLQRILLVLVACLLACSCYLVWRISMVVYGIEQSVARVSEDVKQVSATAAGLARKLDDAIAKLEQLEAKAKASLQVDEAEHMFDEFAEVHKQGRANEGKLSDSSKQEIRDLLEAIRKSDCRFGHDNDIRSAENYYVRLYAKYKAYRDALTSSEDFIKNVSSQTVGGNPYFVVLPSGEKRPLAEWLTEKLLEIRKSQAPKEASKP